MTTKTRDATKADIEQLIERYAYPPARTQVKDWPGLRAALAAQAERFGIALPPYLRDEGARKAVTTVGGGGES